MASSRGARGRGQSGGLGCSIAAARLAPAGGGDRGRWRCRLSSEIQIVPRVEADLPQLFGLAKVAFASMPGWSDERVLEVLEHDVIFVAREKGQPAGYEKGQPAGYVALRRDEGGVIVVEQLFIAPAHERRGIGHQLLAYAEGYAIADRARSLRIVVEDNNQQAQSFYRRSGFVPIEPELLELILPRVD